MNNILFFLTPKAMCSFLYDDYTVRQALEKMGRSIPDDYSLVCFDYSDENPEKEGITCSVTRSYEMGCELGKRLIRMIENKNWDDKNYSHIMKPVIYEGISIREI